MMMEGWLFIPPNERNLITRSTWKARWVRFSDAPLPPPPPPLPTAAMPPGHRASITTASTSRPVTAGSGNSLEGAGSGTARSRRPTLERGHSSHQSTSTLGGISDGQESASPTKQQPREWTLSLFKSKVRIYEPEVDQEPCAVFPIRKIASCYVGDYADKKKAVVQPTLIINLRNDPPSAFNNGHSKSFRRRSHEPLPRDPAARKEGTPATQTLLFRPGPAGSYSLEQWAKAIQLCLADYHESRQYPIRVDTTGSGTREEDEGVEGERRVDIEATPGRSPSSIFLVDGEPNTALLSPSIRSRASNLSSLPSEDRDSFASASSLIFPPNISEEDEQPRPTTSSTLTKPSSIRSASTPLRINTATSPTPSAPIPISSPPKRPETILDRFFALAPSSPPPPGQKISSIARFEALMDNLEARQKLDALYHEAHSSSASSAFKLVSSPTARILKFVTTGYRPPTPPREEPPLRNQTYAPRRYIPAAAGNLSTPTHPHAAQFERRNSDTSSYITLAAAAAASSSNPAAAATSPIDSADYRSPTGSTGKRHSLADFTNMRISSTQRKRAGVVVLEDLIDDNDDDSDEDSVYSDFNDWEFNPSKADVVEGRRRAGTTGGVGMGRGVIGRDGGRTGSIGLGVFSEDEDLSEDDMRQYQWPLQTLKPPVKKVLGQPQGMGGQGGTMFRPEFTF